MIEQIPGNSPAGDPWSQSSDWGPNGQKLFLGTSRQIPGTKKSSWGDPVSQNPDGQIPLMKIIHVQLKAHVKGKNHVF